MSRVLVAATGTVAEEAVTRLRRSGTEVERVAEGVEGLRLLGDREFGCAVSAPDLADMSGPQFLDRARQRRPGLSTVLLVDDLALLDGARQAGVDEVVRRGADEELVAAVEDSLVDGVLRTRGDHESRLYETVTRAMARAVTADDLAGAVTDTLAGTDLYALAWVSEYDPGTDRLVPERAAGIDVDHLDARPRSPDLEADSDTLVREAGSSRQIAVPLAAGGTLHAVLFLTTGRPVSAAERAALAELGTALGALLGGGSEAGIHPQVRQFGSIVSHELRNQLNLARGYLDRVREGEGGGERLEGALDRIAEIADETATIASGEIDPDDLERVDLADLAESAWTTVEPMAGDTELSIEGSDTLFVHPGLMTHALENLFRNSVTHAGGFFRGGESAGPLEIRVGPLENGFYVEDTGRGIPEADRDRVFEWGYTTHPEGDGVGLPLIRQFIEAHGWEVSVSESAEGGARFEITFEGG